MLLRRASEVALKYVLLRDLGVWVVRKLQADMKYSAGGETFKMKYVWQCLTDRQTWLASESMPLHWIECDIDGDRQVGIYMGL